MKKKLLKAVVIFFGIVLAVFLYFLATYWNGIQIWLAEYQQKQELIAQNIYAAGEDYYFAKGKLKWATYMICRFATSEEELKAQIDAFLAENNLVETLTKNHNGCIEVLEIRFIRPTDFIQAGETKYDYGEPMPFSGEMRLCCVTFLAPDFDEPQYEFFPENFVEDRYPFRSSIGLYTDRGSFPLGRCFSAEDRRASMLDKRNEVF